MDLKLVREEAIERATRFFWDKTGIAPDQDSEEWEAEYRRQFELAKQRQAQLPQPQLPRTGARPAAARPGAAANPNPAIAAAIPAEPPPEPAGWVKLTGPPTQIRWAAALRAERIGEVRDPGIRDWLATTWSRAKSWIDTRDLPLAVFLQRIAPHYAEYRQGAAERARVAAGERQQRDAAAAELRHRVEAAGITIDGLIELIDICDRLPAVALGAKLAELTGEGRSLRVFETADPALLMVLDKDASGRGEYAIERDPGLVADLELLMRAMALS